MSGAPGGDADRLRMVFQKHVSGCRYGILHLLILEALWVINVSVLSASSRKNHARSESCALPRARLDAANKKQSGRL
jgi:hypothetical protein